LHLQSYHFHCTIIYYNVFFIISLISYKHFVIFLIILSLKTHYQFLYPYEFLTKTHFMEVIPSIIYHYLSIISYLDFHHSLRSYHFQSYFYMRVYTSTYLNYKFSGFHILPSFKKFRPQNLGFLLIFANIIRYFFIFFISPFCNMDIRNTSWILYKNIDN
jgi:hypothetical protein